MTLRQQPSTIFCSIDGTTSQGGYSADALCQFHAEGSLTDGVLCSTPDSFGNCELWQPLAKLIRSPAEIGSAAARPRSLADLLHLYAGWFIGLNLSEPDLFEPAKLANVTSDFFSVEPKGRAALCHFPLGQILSVTETTAQLDFKMQKPILETSQATVMGNFWGEDRQAKSAQWIRTKMEVPLLIRVNHLPAFKTSLKE